MRILREGMRGPDVKRWQKFLNGRGIYAGAADGIFGEVTHRATVQFQEGQGLVPDGVVGPATLDRAPELRESAEVETAPDGKVIVTPAFLRRVMPAIRPARAAEYASFLQQAMEEFGIDAPARAAAFLAQLAHESGQLRFMEEIWGPTPAQRRYEPPNRLARGLGNTQPGDGKRFKGRGPIQLTGRANYRLFGDALGVDLVANPALAATKEVGFRTAGLYWKKRGLNPLADRRDFRRITRRINGGFNGLADRLRFYALAMRVLGVAPRPAGTGPSGSMRGLDREGGDWRSFTRGLDGPGEVTPTAVQRSVVRGAGARPAARAKKAAGTRRRTTARATGSKGRTAAAAKTAAAKRGRKPARKAPARGVRARPRATKTRPKATTRRRAGTRTKSTRGKKTR